MKYEAFAYSRLCNELKKVGDMIVNKNPDVQAFPDIDYSKMSMPLKDFFALSYMGNDIPESKFTVDVGWKFHIALDDNVQANIEKAWDIIKDILIDNKVRMAKVVRPNVKLAEVKGQEGKQVTIYTWYNSEKTPENWCDIMVKITAELKKAGIKPGQKAKNSADLQEKNCEDNDYLTYRYQQQAERQKSKTSQKVKKNVKNPYKNLSFKIESLLTIASQSTATITMTQSSTTITSEHSDTIEGMNFKKL